MDNLENLASAAPATQFIAIGFSGLKSGPNLSIIGSGDRPDQQGFIAGVVAAILTEDWRVGVITVSDSPAGKAAGLGFSHGVIYFCGLCRPYAPPFVAYPVVIELPAQADQAEQDAAVQSIVSQAVKTVFIFPGADNETLLDALDQAGVQIIGGSQPASQPAHWIASIQADVLPPLQKAWPDIVSGRGGLELQAELAITDINPKLFSPGREELAKKILADLLAGAIDTQVDPQTGDER